MSPMMKAALPVVLRTWVRLVVALIGSQVLLALLGVGDAAGFAVMPAVFGALFQPDGDRRTRLVVTAVGTVLAAVLAVLGGLVAGTTWPLVLGLGLCGLVLGYLPRLGPHAAAIQLTLLTSFVYSAANPGVASLSRGAAVLLALPVFLAATAWLAPPDGRRPLILGAAKSLAELSKALTALSLGEPAAALAEHALATFRTAASRLKSSAMPFEPTSRDHALLMLSGRVPAAVAATVGLDRSAQPDARAWAAVAAHQSAALAAALAGKGPLPPLLEMRSVPRDPSARALRRDLDDLRAAIGALATGEEPVPVLARATRSPVQRVRAGLTTADPVARQALRLGMACLLTAAASVLFGIGKIYWSVFAAVMVLATPSGRVRARMRYRLLGTVAGVVLAGVLVAWTSEHRVLQLVLGLSFILPGLLFMAVNYGWTCFFVATAVGLLYGGLGEQGDFFRFRLLENVIGCCVIVVVMGLTWRGDPWPAAAVRLLRGIADAARSADPGALAPELRRRALVLRDAAADRAAVPDPGQGSVWTFGGAAAMLALLVTGGAKVDPDSVDALADGLAGAGPVPQITADPGDEASVELERLAGAVTELRPRP